MLLLVACIISFVFNVVILPSKDPVAKNKEAETEVSLEHLKAFKITNTGTHIGTKNKQARTGNVNTTAASKIVSNVNTSTTIKTISVKQRTKLKPPRIPVTACLLIKDDNDLLNEWIAYHYHVLDMRYIVLAVDPSSLTSPQPLLQHWGQVTSEMGDPLHTLIWNDTDYMPNDFLQKGYHIAPKFINGDAKASKWHEGTEDEATVIQDNLRIANHRFRQVTFVSACLRHVRNENRTWAIHIDTDEYVVINPVLRQKQKELRSNVSIPKDLQQPSTVIHFLQDIIDRDSHLRTKANYPCVSMPRLLFGSVEDKQIEEKEENIQARLPAGLLNNATLSLQLETLRWKYHTNYTDKDRNAQPKVIIDVSKVPLTDEMFKPKPFSIHRPSKRLCRRIDQLDFYAVDKFPLSLNHYLGTWERYMARNDTRRSERAYKFKASVHDGKDGWIASWIEGFVQRVGLNRAIKLLISS